uniref:Uncharacterized protein n=1 Tax=Anguilla anguilla TaxID=7936 RepID=A0A0E9Q152_ANGAN
MNRVQISVTYHRMRGVPDRMASVFGETSSGPSVTMH